jgi:hypothetical protein
MNAFPFFDGQVDGSRTVLANQLAPHNIFIPDTAAELVALRDKFARNVVPQSTMATVARTDSSASASVAQWTEFCDFAGRDGRARTVVAAIDGYFNAVNGATMFMVITKDGEEWVHDRGVLRQPRETLNDKWAIEAQLAKQGGKHLSYEEYQIAIGMRRNSVK